VCLVFVLGLVWLPRSGWADASAGWSASEAGLLLLVGPQIGIHGPPTSFKAQAQGWHSLTGTLAFVGGVAVNASGATVLRSGDNATADAHYDSTFGMSFWSGLRWLFEGVQWPVLPFVRAGIGVDFTAASALVGYRLGPVGGGGLAFPVGEVIDLVGEVEVGLGFGQYRGSGALLAVSLDVLLGLQMRF